MNIDDIYKPLERTWYPFKLVDQYDPDDIRDLEEKYKELLVDNKKLIKFGQMFVYGSQDLTESIILLEKHTGKTWEELAG